MPSCYFLTDCWILTQVSWDPAISILVAPDNLPYRSWSGELWRNWVNANFLQPDHVRQVPLKTGEIICMWITNPLAVHAPVYVSTTSVPVSSRWHGDGACSSLIYVMSDTAKWVDSSTSVCVSHDRKLLLSVSPGVRNTKFVQIAGKWVTTAAYLIHCRGVTFHLWIFPHCTRSLEGSSWYLAQLGSVCSYDFHSWRSILTCNNSTSTGTSLEGTPMFAHVTLHRTFNPLGSKCPWWQDEEAAS